MRTLMALLAAVMISGAAFADADDCGGQYSGYPSWAQDAFCKPQPGGD